MSVYRGSSISGKRGERDQEKGECMCVWGGGRGEGITPF